MAEMWCNEIERTLLKTSVLERDIRIARPRWRTPSSTFQNLTPLTIPTTQSIRLGGLVDNGSTPLLISEPLLENDTLATR